MKNLIAYFSATGNTAHAVHLLAHRLELAGQEVELLPIFAGQKTLPTQPSWDRLIVAYPVLAMAAPTFVTRWLRANVPDLRKSNSSRDAAVLVCTGGGGGPAAQNTSWLLKKKGYRVVASAQARYAENWTAVGAVIASQEAAEAVRPAGDASVLAFAQALVDEKPVIDRPGPLYWVLGNLMAFLFGLAGRLFLGKLFHANEQCNACGLCERSCPVGAIVLKAPGVGRPYWKATCESCNRCINVCPKQAISVSLAQASLLVLSIGLLSALFIGLAVPLLPALVAAHALVLGPLDATLFRWLRTKSRWSSLFSGKFGRSFPRYLADGFHPKDRAS